MSDKSISLALEIAKRARSKSQSGPDEVRKARLHNLLFPAGDDNSPDLDLSTIDDSDLEAPQAEAKPTSRKDRLMAILSKSAQKPVKKDDE